ncbi:MAG: DUF1460 domain-containing protein [Bacteroidales bacterium]|nr:DUF1460 domain-containing protein [Candidatus Liminaster caballi]
MNLRISLLTLFLVLAHGAWAQCYDLVVAKDGSGDYTCIQEAINAIRDYKPEGRQRILVRNGIYEEKVIVPSYKSNISLIGESVDSTILVWHDYADLRTPSGWPEFSLEGERQAQQRAYTNEGRKIGTFQTYTLRVDGPGFECENMTIANDAMTYWNPSWTADRKNTARVSQAVAVHIEGDRTVFRCCRLKGFQDTVFTGNEDSRQIFYQCYIEGTVDFIFGPATCWFESCQLHAISNGYITAASTPAHHHYGYFFYRCNVTADPAVTNEWLGRPWRNYASVIFRECEFPAVINPQGWNNWSDPAREKTARYYEYMCTGPGADTTQRVGWMSHLPRQEWNQQRAHRVLNAGHSTPWQSNYAPVSFHDMVFAFYDQFTHKGTKYEGGVLDAPYRQTKDKPSHDLVSEREPLVIRLDALDCTTFVEYMCAGMIGRVANPNANDSIFQRFVQALRYRQGKRGNYASRKHYFSEWIADNEAQGFVEEITSTIPGAKSQRRTLNFMSANRHLYPALAASDSLTLEMAGIERRLSEQTTWYIPRTQVHKIYKYLQEGDIIAFVSGKDGLDVLHCGFVWWPERDYLEPQLLHASSAEGQVTVTHIPLADYTQAYRSATGIRVIRMK